MIATGHQPELFHPGVWAKNFAAARLAEAVGGTAVNFVVDSDTLKSNALAVPHYDPTNPAEVRLIDVPFDDPGPEQAFAERRVRSPELFRTFPDRVAELSQYWPFEPMLPAAWHDVLTAGGETLGEKFAHARRQQELRWGVDLPNSPVTLLSKSAGFQEFASRILHDLPRFAESYNAAVRAYRSRYKLKSRTHPVPELQPGEAPFWGPGRSRATPNSDPKSLTPRALTLTLFVRLCRCDVFLHGIGGGKYDEVTDAVMQNYFGVDPPGFIVVTRTEHLPFPPFPAADERQSERVLRDLAWNPRQPLERAVLNETLRDKPAGRESRRRWFRDIRALKAAWQPHRAELKGAADRDVKTAKTNAAANGVLRRRDCSWVLFPEPQLLQLR